MTLYLDTNIFIYIADKFSLFNKECQDFVEYCQNNDILLVTSVETIQEIIYLAKNMKETERGLEAAQICLKMVDELIPVFPTTINVYLEQVEKYLKSSSRDLLHLATCIENDFKIAITFDKDFSKFVDIASFTPRNFLAKYSETANS